MCEVPLSFSKAALGGTIEVPTIDGAVNLSIPNETQSGKVFRLRGKGVKSYRDRTTGDLFCSIQIETPVNLNNEQKNILKTFEESINSSKKEHRPNKNKWSESVKSFFNRLGI